MKQNLKKVLNATWKVSVVVIGVFAFILTFRIGQLLYREYFGRDEWNDKTLSCDVVVKAYKRDRCRVYNKKTKSYTTPRLRFVSGRPERDSITVFCDMDGYRGFLNANTGEIVIPAQYGKAWQFSDGLAGVIYEKNKLGFINHDNELVIKDVPYERGFQDYLFENGFITIRKYDYINDCWNYSVYSSSKLGKVDGADYISIESLSDNDYKIAENDEGYWLLDPEYNRVFAEPYDYIEDACSEDGIYVTRNYVKQRVDCCGNVLDPFVIDGTSRLCYITGLNMAYYDSDGDLFDQDYDAEFEPELITYRVNRRFGLMNAHTGAIITPAKYGKITMISKELLMAEVNSFKNESVLLDRKGRMVELTLKK